MIKRKLKAIRTKFTGIDQEKLLDRIACLEESLLEKHRNAEILLNGLKHPSSEKTSDTKKQMKDSYTNFYHKLLDEMTTEEAMSVAVSGKGGGYKETGLTEVALLQYCGLLPEHHLVDVGCGSGRLAKPLSKVHSGKYSGFDIVRDAVDYAREFVGRSDWRFEEIDGINIPEKDNSVDMVCFFSVFTHILHEYTYWYLEESIRVLKPGGKIVFSFLEFAESHHWHVFTATLSHTKESATNPLNVFMHRGDIQVWAEHLNLVLEGFYGATENPWGAGPLGQTVCVLTVPHP